MIRGGDVTHHVDIEEHFTERAAVDDAPITTAIEIAELGEQLAPLRLRSPDTMQAIERSLSRDGQLAAVVCHRRAGVIEMSDGFKRLAGARKLGWSKLRAEIHQVHGPGAKLLL